MAVIVNGVPYINGKLYDWADIVVGIAGVPVTGITAVSYSDKQDVKPLYGAGRYPVGYSKGRITAAGKITLYQEEVEAIQSRCPNGRVQDIAPFDITVSYMPDSGVVKTDKLCNCIFSENVRDWKENAAGGTVELPIVMSHIKWAK